VERCVVIEEGDPFLAEAIRAAGIAVEAKPEPFRFGELNAGRVRRILAGDDSPEPEIMRQVAHAPWHDANFRRGQFAQCDL